MINSLSFRWLITYNDGDPVGDSVKHNENDDEDDNHELV